MSFGPSRFETAADDLAMRFSIALCTYNGARWLPVQLESYREQTRSPDELVVCDDGSTDETLPLVERFAAAAPFPVVVHRQPTNLGSTANFGDAIARCSGSWIFLSDQDDRWKPEKLARFEQAIQHRPDIRLWASDADVVDDDLRPRGDRLWSALEFDPRLQAEFESNHAARMLARRNMITGAVAAFHASCRSLILPIPTGWFHDAWIALVASAVAPCALLREPLIDYRHHATQQVGAARLTLSRQIELARRMDAAYFEKQATFFESAVDRLADQPLRDAGLLDHLNDKVEFCRARGRMRTGNRLRRLAMILREAAAGRYHRHAQGWKAIAADALL